MKMMKLSEHPTRGERQGRWECAARRGGGCSGPQPARTAVLWGKVVKSLTTASWGGEEQKLPLLKAQFRKLKPPKLNLSMKVFQMPKWGTAAPLFPL